MNERREQITPTRECRTEFVGKINSKPSPSPQFKPKGERVDGTYIAVKKI